MKTLVGVTYSGNSKSYVLNTFKKMAEVCIEPYADIVWFGDQKVGESHVYIPHPNDNSEDVLMATRDEQRKYAQENWYDKLVWQGVDCLYRSAEDFQKLIGHNLPAVGALTCARGNSNHAVAAQFHQDLEGWIEEYSNFPDELLASGKVIAAGIPGADAMVLSYESLDLCWHGNHDPWYVRKAQGRWEIAAEAWYGLELMRTGRMVWLDTSIKTWHVHEDRIARMWKGIETRMEDLTW